MELNVIGAHRPITPSVSDEVFGGEYKKPWSIRS